MSPTHVKVRQSGTCFPTVAEAGGVTTLIVTMKYASKAERDDTLATGATDGMEHNYLHLDGMLAG